MGVLFSNEARVSPVLRADHQVGGFLSDGVDDHAAYLADGPRRGS